MYNVLNLLHTLKIYTEESALQKINLTEQMRFCRQKVPQQLMEKRTNKAEALTSIGRLLFNHKPRINQQKRVSLVVKVTCLLDGKGRLTASWRPVNVIK